MLSRRWLVLPASLCLCVGVAAWAQEQSGQDQQQQEQQPQGQAQDGQDRRDRGRRGDGQRGRWNPEEMRQRLAERLKEQLQATDEEWQVLQPKIEKVVELQFTGRGGMFGRGGWGGRGGGREDGQQAQRPESDYARASRELRTTLEDQNATPEQIAERLKTVREAREKTQTELESARNELKELVTQRQEAQLVMMGLLE